MLLVLAGVLALCVANMKPNIRAITIEELLSEHPDLKASLSAKITKPQASSEPPSSTARTSTTTTTTPVPQADSPAIPTAATTPAGRRGRGRQPGARRRKPVGETSDRFGGEEAGHRLRVVPTQEPRQRNARTFPGAQ